MPEDNAVVRYLTKQQLDAYLMAVLTPHVRMGQAFFNVLSEDDQNKLGGSPADPFYYDDYAHVEAAIKFLEES